MIVSGDIGVHGVAIMSVREGLQFGTEIESDCQPLNGLVATMLAVDRRPPRAARPDARWPGHLPQRDRGRVRRRRGSSTSGSCRSRRSSRNACAFLGLDPLQVANEGKLVAFVPPEHADAVLEAMRAHPAGADATVIGECVEEHPGMVVDRTRASGPRGSSTCRSASSCRGSADA